MRAVRHQAGEEVAAGDDHQTAGTAGQQGPDLVDARRVVDNQVADGGTATGDALAADKEFGSVESVKAAADVYMPISGEVTAVNEDLRADPSLSNKDPLGGGWFFRMKIKDMARFDELMDEPAYQKFVKANA